MNLKNLFKFKKKNSESDFYLDEGSRSWVEDNFIWFVSRFGKPKCHLNPIEGIGLIDTPAQIISMSLPEFIRSVKAVLDISEVQIDVEYVDDIRSVYGFPYESQEGELESWVLKQENQFVIYVTSHLKEKAKRLRYRLLLEHIKIKVNLADNNSEWLNDLGDDWLNMIGTWFGLGAQLVDLSVDVGHNSNSQWVVGWNHVDPLYPDTRACIIALTAKFQNQQLDNIAKDYPSYISTLLQGAIEFINREKKGFLRKENILALYHFYISTHHYNERNFKAVIEELSYALPLSETEELHRVIENNLGYYLSIVGDFDLSKVHLKNVIASKQDYAYALDNLGYCLMMTDSLEEGKHLVEQAMRTENNYDAYSYRNLAIYHHKKNELNESYKYFMKSFENKREHIDLLDYHFSLLLFDMNEKERGLKHLSIAIKNQEPLAVEKMRLLKMSSF